MQRFYSRSNIRAATTTVKGTLPNSGRSLTITCTASRAELLHWLEAVYLRRCIQGASFFPELKLLQICLSASETVSCNSKMFENKSSASELLDKGAEL
jgi:hypothetical protein